MVISDLAEGSELRALWAAVLLHAIKDMDLRSEAEAAKYWMYKDERRGVGSFEWICSVLDLDGPRIALLCTTRQGRWKVLGTNHIGQQTYQENKRKGVLCVPTRIRRERPARRTSRSRVKPNNSSPE